MAIFHLSAQIISRKAGRSATSAAAYRAGEKVIDERTGEIHDYTRKGGVLYSQVVMPKSTDWAPSRAELWNAVEAKNKRADAQVAREFVVALPDELDAEQRQRLALAFTQELADTYGIAADLCLHAPGKAGDQRNHHAHILTSTNLVVGHGFGNKQRELDLIAHGQDKTKRDKPNGIDAVRLLWEQRCNFALALARSPERVSRLSNEARGIEELPTVHLGPKATAIERRGGESRIAADARQKVQEVLAKAQADAAIERARDARIQTLQAALEQAHQEQVRENDDGIRAETFSLIDCNVDATSRDCRAAEEPWMGVVRACSASAADLSAPKESWRGTVDAVSASAKHLNAGRDHARANGRDLGRALEGAQRRIAERDHARAVAAAEPKLSQVGRVLQRVAGGCLATVLAITKALSLSREERQAAAYARKEEEGKALHAAMLAERAKTAQEAFLEQHKGLPRATRGQLSVGRVDASEGPFAVLHVGRGNFVLHEFPSEQAVRDFERGQDKGQGLGR